MSNLQDLQLWPLTSSRSVCRSLYQNLRKYSKYSMYPKTLQFLWITSEIQYNAIFFNAIMLQFSFHAKLVCFAALLKRGVPVAAVTKFAIQCRWTYYRLVQHKALLSTKWRRKTKMSKIVPTVQAPCVWNATKISKEMKSFLGCTGHLNNFWHKCRLRDTHNI